MPLAGRSASAAMPTLRWLFFFSSRRRHTRWPRDWSSDVCSSDLLAFGHFVIAIAFIGPLRNPVKNIWVVEFGMIACVLVVPFALVMGGVRGIPFGWRLVDCSFGVFGIIPLWFCRQQIKHLTKLAQV